MSGLMQKQIDRKLLSKNLGRGSNCQVCKKYQLFLWSYEEWEEWKKIKLSSNVPNQGLFRKMQ